MDVRNDLTVVPFRELLVRLADAASTGRVTVAQESGVRTLWLAAGKLVAARGANPSEELPVLVERLGLLEPDTLQNAMAEARRRSVDLAVVLADESFLGVFDVVQLREAQIEGIVRAIAENERSGTATFAADKPAPHSPIPELAAALDVGDLLSELDDELGEPPVSASPRGQETPEEPARRPAATAPRLGGSFAGNLDRSHPLFSPASAAPDPRLLLKQIAAGTIALIVVAVAVHWAGVFSRSAPETGSPSASAVPSAAPGGPVGEQNRRHAHDRGEVPGPAARGHSAEATENSLAEPPAAGRAAPVTTTSSSKLDINTATAAALEKLPGIGKVTAGNIVRYRDANGPFAALDDLSKVPRLNKSVIDKLRPYARAGSGQAAAPSASASASEKPASPHGRGLGRPVNINTATQADLETLKKIGPATARRIIEYREKNGPFKDIGEIQNVKGIGPKTFEGIQDDISVK
ncbi:MAG: helix-hairpin-helix domain-containing protein [Candidatus Schekmanbacteria bacterium]|nr:helix-hairpin-helix domain-containing protein [Candidatus Schekmanbacteria bacterium]